MKYVVIGGVAAGMSAATKIRRLDKESEILVYEKGPHLSYGACGLPYFVSNVNDDVNKLFARKEEDFNNQNIQTFLHHEVIKVMPESKKILIRNHVTQTFKTETYDKLLIASGASASRPNIKGAELSGVYYLKTLEDAITLKPILNQDHIQNIVVIGGGYIGIELVDACLELNKNVTCIEAGEQILSPFDTEIVNVVKNKLLSKHVNLCEAERVTQILGDNNVTGVLTNHAQYEADLVILSAGVKPNTAFLKGTDVVLAPNGAIKIDKEMRTSLKDIWAAGDCTMVYHNLLQEDVYMPLGTHANKCGRIAGENMVGYHKKFAGVLGSSALKVSNLELGRTGLSEGQAILQRLNYKTVVVDVYDHPGYYPNQTPIKLKLIYDTQTKRILGAQAIGEKGAVLRIDMFAIAIQNQMTVEELGMMDLIYAPPFSGVWDPVQIACNAAK